MRICLASVVVLAFTISLASTSTAEPISVKLAVTERAGYARVDEPVTFGLPLPLGAVMDVSTLRLIDEAGKPIPASFSVAQVWQPAPGREGHRPGSVRWVHVSCLLSVPARGTKTIVVTNASGASAGQARPLNEAQSAIRVTSNPKAGTATVQTGPVKLVLNAKLPGVIESGTLGDKQVISDSAGSVTAGGKTFTEIAPVTASVEVLESGPMRAVVLLRGTFKGANAIGSTMAMPGTQPDADAVKGQQAGPGLVYEARVYAYANSPRVFVDYTIINKIGAVAANKIDLEDLSIGLRTVGDGPGEVMISRPGMPLITKLLNRASFNQPTAEDYQIDVDDKPALRGGAKAARATTLGWVGGRLGQVGLAVGVRDVWQTYPKKIEITKNWDAALKDADASVIRIGLYPKEYGKPQELFIGQARTHRLTLVFHDGKADPLALNAIFASTNVPLMPVAEPAWYCQATQAWGPITSADLDYGPFADVEKHYNQVLSDTMANIVRNVEVGLTDTRKDKAGNIIKSVTQDGYGWMNWGDSFFRIGVAGKSFPEPHKNLSWNGNYYDYGMTMLYQWARTGDWRYFDHGLRAGAYTADVFNNHWYPDPNRIGACHYCPPRYHAAIDDGTPYVSEQFNHAKVQSITMRWQLLGDWWARQCMLETYNHAASMRGSENAAWRQCRGNGHLLHMLWSGYEFTGERRYIDRAATLLKLGVAFIKKNTEFDKAASQRFMVGVALEGMIQSQWLNPDKDVSDTIKFVADYAVDEQKLKGYTANMAMAYGWLWKQTGDVKYLRTLARLIRATGPSQHAKYFGQTFRSTPYAIGWLYDAAKAGVTLPQPPAIGPETTNELMMLK